MKKTKSLVLKLNKKHNIINEIVYRDRKTYTTKVFFNERELLALSKIKITKEQLKRDEIYLREKNLSCNSTKTFEIVRDIFVANAFVGLRFSDMVNLDRSNFLLHPCNNTPSGYDLTKSRIIIYNKKSNKDVYIPIKPIVLKIFQKYNFKLPMKSDVTIIVYMQYLGKLLGMNEKTQKITYQDNERIVYEVPKYELIGTHTARRSFATNAYLHGDIPPKAIMMITEHSKIETFMKYICVGDRDLATIAADSNFFK